MRILLPDAVTGLWRAELRRAGRREIGGVLLGEALADGSFRVVEASVQREGGDAGSFVRDPAHHARAIADFFERTGHDYARFNYLGEWHSHPSFSTRPSADDARAMEELVADPRVGAAFACLLIVRLTLFRRLDVGSYVFSPGSPMVSATTVREASRRAGPRPSGR